MNPQSSPTNNAYPNEQSTQYNYPPQTPFAGQTQITTAASHEPQGPNSSTSAKPATGVLVLAVIAFFGGMISFPGLILAPIAIVLSGIAIGKSRKFAKLAMVLAVLGLLLALFTLPAALKGFSNGLNESVREKEQSINE